MATKVVNDYETLKKIGNTPLVKLNSLSSGNVISYAKLESHNPFGSVFWAVMGMAAELSTGAIVYAYASDSNVKFILIGMEAKFLKKVKGKSFYFCDAGLNVSRSFEEVINNSDTSIVLLPVIASDEAGQILAEFTFTWQLRKPIS